jgi:CHRD domain
MKSMSVLAVVFALCAAGCGSSSSSTSPTSGAPTFTATLSPANETPPITNAESVGSGTATMVFNVTKDASGNISTASVDFTASMFGFPSTTVVTIAHIHQGAFGVGPGPVVVPAVAKAGTIALTNGSGTFTATQSGVDPALAQSIINNPSNYYFNIHTSLNPGGVMRGQLVKVQ